MWYRVQQEKQESLDPRELGYVLLISTPMV